MTKIDPPQKPQWRKDMEDLVGFAILAIVITALFIMYQKGWL